MKYVVYVVFSSGKAEFIAFNDRAGAMALISKWFSWISLGLLDWLKMGGKAADHCMGFSQDQIGDGGVNSELIAGIRFDRVDYMTLLSDQRAQKVVETMAEAQRADS